MTFRFAIPARWGVALALLAARAGLVDVPARAGDRIKELQTAYVATKDQKVPRAYHFGSQGPGDVFSNHASHTNRLVPIYTFGWKADLGAVTGANSLYRDPRKVKALYGFLPENTVNPEAEYADQSDLYRVQMDAVARGARAPVHRLVRRPRLADHAGRRDRQDGPGLHRGEGLGADLPG